ncbi:MAG: LacI family transcriptional regulator [Tissierellia bacterium]|nr:LacI family transcriptional regulator [Tissierellia bacterium]
MTATIKDVAKMAGVSISTVSRVINDSKPVSPESRRKVLKAIDELQYEPNEIARSLVTKKSNIIGVIVNDIGKSYVSQVVRGIEEVGRMYNYDILLSSTYGDSEAETKYVKLLQQKQVEGIIIISEIHNAELMEYLEAMRLPFVYLNRFYIIEKLPTVSISNKKGAIKMTNHLVEQGHKKIAYISFDKDNGRNVELYKIEGYSEVMEGAGLNPMIINLPNTSPESYIDIMSKIIDKIKNNEITAIFAHSDESAIKIINLLYDEGIKVPEDVSVVGFSDIDMASIYRPRLTSVKEPFYDYGAVSARRLLKEISGEGTDEEKIYLPEYVIERETVKKLD